MKETLSNILFVTCPHCGKPITVMAKLDDAGLHIHYLEGKENGKEVSKTGKV